VDQQTAEQRLEDLHREHAATRAMLEMVKTDLASTAQAMTQARAIYDLAAQDFARAVNAHGGASHAPGETWRPRSDAEAVQVRMAAETATATLEQARAELDPVRRRHTALDRRRGELRAHLRYLEGQMAAVEAELAGSRATVQRRRGLLDEIRARVLERG
jgi:chromosome segregation ATPase